MGPPFQNLPITPTQFATLEIETKTSPSPPQPREILAFAAWADWTGAHPEQGERRVWCSAKSNGWTYLRVSPMDGHI
jgi:hypothetical protein